MDSLPELPFEKVLSYLSLEDRLKSRAVSRSWRNQIDNFRVRSLCCSERPLDFIKQKRRWISGEFLQNFISSTRFASFMNTFGQTTLSNLRHLRLCTFLSAENRTAFTRLLNSFGQLEELDLIRFGHQRPFDDLAIELELYLPCLTSLQLIGVYGIEEIVLDSPRLRKVKIGKSFFSLKLEHAESVERLTTDWLEFIPVTDLKNLQYLVVGCDITIESTFLSHLKQLKEVHLARSENVPQFLDQKQQYHRTDLQVYFRGLPMNEPDDLAIGVFDDYEDTLNEETFAILVEDPARLADEIPLCSRLRYPVIEALSASSEIAVLKRLIDLQQITVTDRIEQVGSFLYLLQSVENLVRLEFQCDQCDDLFERLPAYCAVQRLYVNNKHFYVEFLFRLKHLLRLDLSNLADLDVKFLKRVFSGSISRFSFYFGDQPVSIRIDRPKQFEIYFDYSTGWKSVPDLEAAIQLIMKRLRYNKWGWKWKWPK